MSKLEPITIPKSHDQAHFSVSEDQINLELLDRDISSSRKRGIDFGSYLKIIVFGFQFHLKDWMFELDPTFMKIVNELLKMSPGYKSTQYIFTYYLLTSGISNAFAMALIYPLPYALLFSYVGLLLSDAQQNQNWNYSPLILIILTGVRASLIALLGKYALVAPEGKFYWVVLISTFIICTFFRSNYVYIILYMISIFLSFYVKQDARRSSVKMDHNEKQVFEYRQIRGVPKTYPGICIFALGTFILGAWLLERYNESWASFVMLQFIFIGLLNNTKVMLIFFPFLYSQIYSIPHLKAFDLVGINFILPGSHIKPFFSLIGNDFNFTNFLLTYLCLYLPSIMIACIYIGYRKHFYSAIWNDSLKAMQAVSNGMIWSMISYIIVDEECNFGPVLYGAICIFCVVQLYDLREIVGALLGVFLIFSRAGVLYLNKGLQFQKFLCLKE